MCRIPLSLVSDLNIYPSRWSLFTFSFAAVFSSMPAVTYIVERMVRVPARSQQISSSSRNLTSILAKYVPEWMGEDAFDGLFFLLHGYSATYVPMLILVESDDFSRSAKVQKLPASRSSSELSAHEMAPSGVIAH